MELKTVAVDIDLAEIVRRLRPSEQVELIRTICANIGEEGVIDRIRAVVNEAKYDD